MKTIIPVTHLHYGDMLTFEMRSGRITIFQPGGKLISSFNVDITAVQTQQQFEEQVSWWLYENGAL